MFASTSPVFWDDLARIGAAALLGGAIGLEREWKGHWAGLRTHMMVATGCAIFVISGIAISGERSEAVTRVIQGIASGIGFLVPEQFSSSMPRSKSRGLRQRARSGWQRPSAPRRDWPNTH